MMYTSCDHHLRVPEEISWIVTSHRQLKMSPMYFDQAKECPSNIRNKLSSLCLLQTVESEGAPSARHAQLQQRCVQETKLALWWSLSGTATSTRKKGQLCIKKLKILYIFIESCPLYFRIVTDFIEAPFLAWARLLSAWACARTLPWCRHGVLRLKGVF